MRIESRKIDRNIPPRVIRIGPEYMSVHMGEATLWHVAFSRIARAEVKPGWRWFGLLPNAGTLLIHTADGDVYSEETSFFDPEELAQVVKELNRIAAQNRSG